MTDRAELRDLIANTLYALNEPGRGRERFLANAVMPIIDAELARVRTQVAQEIAEALEAASNICGQTYNAAEIARQHAGSS